MIFGATLQGTRWPEFRIKHAGIHRFSPRSIFRPNFHALRRVWGVWGEQRDFRVGGWSSWYYWWRPYNYNALVAKGWPPIKATDLAAALKGCIRHGSGFDPDHVSMQWLAILWSSFQVFFLAFRYFSSVAVTLCSYKCLNQNSLWIYWCLLLLSQIV